MTISSLLSSSRRPSPNSPLLCWLVMLSVLLFVPACGDESEQNSDTSSSSSSGGDADTSSSSSSGVDTSSSSSSGVDTSSSSSSSSSGDMVSDTDTSSSGDTTDTSSSSSGGDVPSDVVDECSYGEIYGRVCSPNGDDWLFGVEVTVRAVDCSGNDVVVQAFTDTNGYYLLSSVPNGIHTLSIKTGSFSTDIDNVPVEGNKTTDLTGQTTKTCLDRSAAEIAVLTGVFDNYQELLFELGIKHSLYEGDSAGPGSNSIRDGQALLSAADPSELLSYDILIINSGEWYNLFDPLANRDADIAKMQQNIQLFVQSGGSLLVSDWAYYFVELSYPAMIDFFGDDTVEGSARTGNLNPMLSADVLSTDFLNLLGGQSNINLNFNWPAWVVIEDALRGETTIHLQATSINTDDMQTLEEVPVVISFQPSETSGTIYFTSFHADANEDQMKAILRFLVFQL